MRNLVLVLALIQSVRLFGPQIAMAGGGAFGGDKNPASTGLPDATLPKEISFKAMAAHKQSECMHTFYDKRSFKYGSDQYSDALGVCNSNPDTEKRNSCFSLAALCFGDGDLYNRSQKYCEPQAGDDKLKCLTGLFGDYQREHIAKGADKGQGKSDSSGK